MTALRQQEQEEDTGIMQSEPDTIITINSEEREAAGKNAEKQHTTAESSGNRFRKIMLTSDRISKMGRAVSSKVKAGIAVLVLAASCAVLFYETDGFRMLYPNGNRLIGDAAGFSKTAQDAASEVLHSGLSGHFEYAGTTLKKALDKETASLRWNYRTILDRGQGASYQPGSGAEQKIWEEVRAERKQELSENPLLLLVNKWHYLPENYTADPVELPNGQTIGRECYEPLMQMLEDCAAAGGTPIVCSGYRPHYKQVDLYSAQIDRWLYAGFGQEEAEAQAATAVAIPGTSEHELGLAADIYSSENMNLDESQVGTFTQQWLMDNCWRYGFVLRYPQEKSEITGIIFEPWHYRYVGRTHARKIHEAGICLEEYLDETEHPDDTEEAGENADTEEGTNLSF